MDALDFTTATAKGPEETLRTRYEAGGLKPTRGHAHLLRASGWAREGHVEIRLEHHAILRYTPCGAWVDTWAGERFVNLRAGKQWASTTEAEAVDQLYHRKRAQVRILGAQLAGAEAVQAAMEKHLGKKPPPPRPRYYGSEYEFY